jgi:hypothetical protein
MYYIYKLDPVQIDILGYCNSGYGSFRETKPPNLDSARWEEAIGIWFGRFWNRRYTTLHPLNKFLRVYGIEWYQTFHMLQNLDKDGIF